jgi:hypothetical protein
MNRYYKPLGILTVSKPCYTVLKLHTFHLDQHLSSPHYPYIHFSSHPALITFPSPHLTDLHPTSVPFTSLNTILTFSLYVLDFPPLQNPLTSLHSSHFSPFSWKCSISSSLRIPSTSLHFTYHFPNRLPKDARFRGLLTYSMQQSPS